MSATTAWLCSNKEIAADGIICNYGSRIRGYQNVTPKSPTLLFFANQETSVDVIELEATFKEKDNVTIYVLDGKHGFSHPFSNKCNAQSSKVAKNIVDEFLIRIRKDSPNQTPDRPAG